MPSAPLAPIALAIRGEPAPVDRTFVPLDWRPFADLTVAELHAILKLRVDVFVVEQACPYAEIDGLDPAAEHAFARTGDTLLGTLRLFAPDAAGSARIGRVAVAPEARGTGLGRRMIEAAIARIAGRDGPVPIDVDAQAHLERFYVSLGFVRRGPDRPVDGIAHVEMRRPGSAG